VECQRHNGHDWCAPVTRERNRRGLLSLHYGYPADFAIFIDRLFRSTGVSRRRLRQNEVYRTGSESMWRI
jgi:hypothetical protein